MRVLVDRGKREGEGEILLMRMGRREEERERWRLVMRMYWCFTGRKAACSCWPCSKLCARIGEKPTAEPIERGRRWRKVEERENERVGEGERADDRERERERAPRTFPRKQKARRSNIAASAGVVKLL